MKILITTILGTSYKIGISEYLIGLINSLQIIDKKNKYFIVTTKQNRHLFNLKNQNFYEIIIDLREVSKSMLRLQYLIYSKIKIPKLVRKYNIDLLHEPSSWFVNKKIPTVVTIHDVVELNKPKYNFFFNLIKQKMIKSSLTNSRSIITVSWSSKKEIQKFFTANIKVIYNGLPKLKNNSEIRENEILNKYGLIKKNYFIFVGSLIKHKNLITLLKSFKKFSLNENNIKLVFAGSFGNEYQNINNYIRNNNLSDKIVITGYFSDTEKESLIKNSISLILVSKEEGFGLPILEAQSIGIPVITSNVSAMKEIANNCAILIDPNSIDDIAEAMEIVLSNNDKIEEIKKHGLLNVKRFDWINTAKETLVVYETILNQNRELNRF